MSKIVISGSQLKTLNSSRKRDLNIVEWRDTKAKISRQSGLPYEGRNGKLHSAISVPLAEKVCCKRCKLDGCWIFPERKLELWEEFWKDQADNYNRQQSILSGLMDMAGETDRVAAINKNKCNWRYFLKNTDGRKVECCYKSFLNIFKVTKSRIENLQKGIRLGKLSFEDRRGLGSNPRKLTAEQRATILQHINSFPTYISHYSRANGDPERKYLEAELNVTQMHRLYCEMLCAAIDSHKEPESLSTYRQVFLETGLKFGLPKTDTCDTCDTLHRRLREISNNNVVAIRDIEREIEAHHLKADTAYNHLRIDTQLAKASNDVVTLCIDMQQVMMSPKISASDSFYRTKFSSFNVAVSNPAADNSHMFFWDEVDGRRGQIEISTIIHKYITENFTLLEPGQSRTLNFWSDRCVAQNNNYQNVSLFKYLTLRGYFTVVNQKFLVTGHSFLPCDRHFAVVERYAKYKRSSIKVPSDWMRVIVNSRPQSPFPITKLTYKDFQDFDILRTLIPKPESLKVTKFHVIASDIRRPFVYFTKTSHDDPNATVHPIIHPGNLSKTNVNSLRFGPAYHIKFVISERKAADVRSLLRFLSTEERNEWNDLLPPIPQAQHPAPRPEAISDHSYSAQSIIAPDDHDYI
ncbi:unnamed protein product [Allacma fusca]|uniref:Uncharacterized protein n=1 Tax=Allacma fusca TaxID=39272 RepID=A0A8J2NSA1_9HEXA|nr:unnamed protein product [Allacma fusca]